MEIDKTITQKSNVWFDNTIEIECSIETVFQSLRNIAEHFVQVVSKMPGLTEVELIKHGEDFVTIKTNEGLMQRTDIILNENDGKEVLLQYNEDYQAGKILKVQSHHMHKFTTHGKQTRHRIVISNVRAPGILGLLYRLFGKANIGNAIAAAYKKTFESTY